MRGKGDKGSAAPGVFGLAKGLGWFSIALGATQLLAPKLLTRPLALEGREGITRACGARELISGIGILGTRKPGPWLWLRSGGDALDLAGLALHASRSSRRRGLLWFAVGSVAAIAALDVLSASKVKQRRWPARPATHDYSDRSGFAQPIEAVRGIAAQRAEATPLLAEAGALKAKPSSRQSSQQAH